MLTLRMYVVLLAALGAILLALIPDRPQAPEGIHDQSGEPAVIAVPPGLEGH